MTPRRHIIPVFVPHLGCLNDCVFCNQKRISEPCAGNAPDGQPRTRVRNFLKTTSLSAACVSAAALRQSRYREEALLRRHSRSGRAYEREHGYRPGRIASTEDTSRLRRYGVRTIELGALWTRLCSPLPGAAIRRRIPNASRLIKQYGFELILQMMTAAGRHAGKGD